MIDKFVPTIIDLVEYQLPEPLRSPNNSQFIALLKHYYEWLTSVGQPTDFIQNILAYRDIDLTNPMFMKHLTASLVDIIPAYTKADKTLLTKHLVDFLKAKGSVESFKFIMNAIYGEDITMEWNSNKLFRASANEYSRTASLAIESTNAWNNVVGAKVTQTFPSPASALISEITSTVVNGIHVNWLSLDSKSVIGTFVPAGTVECTWNTINRAWFREIYYYTPASFSNHNLIFTATFEEARPYENLIVKQLNTNFRAVISSFVSRQQETGRTRVTLTTKNETGTFISGNELYIFPIALENTLYTNASIEYGTVSNSIIDVNIIDPGALYTHGEHITFQGGSGVLVDGYIAEVTTGGIDTVNIIKKGYGYSVGDSLKVINSNTIGNSTDIVVSSIDGIGAAISTISELNTTSIINGGSGFFVNDEIEVSDGVSLQGTSPIRFRVSSVASSWLFKGASVSTNGSGYPLYSIISLINSSTLTNIPGFSATPIFDTANGISSLTIKTIPTIATGSLLIIANGYGATANTIISAGAITGLVSTNVGVNYIDPIVTIIGNGVGAIAQAVMTNGTVTSFTMVKNGTGYTTASVTISERYGSGFSAIPLIQNQTTGSGSITGLTVLSRGSYTTIPLCFNNALISKIGNGVGAIISMDMRLKALSIDNNGQYYHGISTSVSGIGKNAVILPKISNGVVSSINTISGGTGYTYANVYIIGGYGFIGTVVISSGVITGITIINGGAQYSTTDVINIIGDGAGASFNLLGTNNIINGVMSSVVVENGGNSYVYNTSISCPVSQSGAVPATISPVITNGVITSVTVIGGHGYIESDLTNIVINSGASPTLTTTVSGNGGIVGYSAIDTGYGYNSQSEITPLSITTGVAGVGAVFLPSLDSTGAIISVKVLDGGNGYTLSSTIIVSGGNGTNASLKPVVFNGKITDVTVIQPGFGYKYGTYAILLGDGNNAAITPIVETGITSVEIVNGGMYYTSSAQIIVTDPTGSGADVRATITNGAITALTIFNKGIGYTNPTLTVSGYGIGAILTATAKRFISDLQITNKGTGYSYAEIIIIGDGSNSNYTLTFDKMGSIDSSVISTVGSGITSTPIVTISDNSGFGAVSGLKIISQGAGYQIPPLVLLDNKVDSYGNILASGTKFTCYGSLIGGVKKVMFTHNGANYNDIPTPIFPFVAVLTENAAFKNGETVITRSGTYRNLSQTNYTTMENSNTIILEDGSRLLQDMNDVFFETGVSAIVDEFDFDRNIIELNMSSDMFAITTEDDIPLWTEDEIDVVSQSSGTFEVGDVLIGLKSNAMATIGYSYRANGVAVAGGNDWSDFSFTTDTGKLNNKLSIIADNNRYQDYAYVIKAGIALSEYEALLKSTVHPAGYAMFGDIRTQTAVNMDIFNEIGYNIIATLLYIISINSMYQSGTEWNDIASLYGDLVKFNYKYMPISNIASYQVQQVSDITFENYQEYTGAVSVGGDTNFAQVSSLLHMEGTNGSNIFTDQKGHIYHAGTGTPTISTAQSKFGTGSLLIGNGQSISTPSNIDFTFGAGDFTVEAWVYLTAYTSLGGIALGQGDYASVAGSSYILSIGTSGSSDLYIYGGVYSIANPVPPLNGWHHVAYVRNGTNFTSYLDGVTVGHRGDLGTMPVNTGYSWYNPSIGGMQTGLANYSINGYIDEIRITKGVARYIANFTPSTVAFPDSLNGNTSIMNGNASIVTPNISQWTIVNNGQILNNVGLSPDGSTTMVELSDTSAISISGFSHTVSCNAGDTITFEMIIGKQVNSLTIPHISIGADFVDFNPSSGQYTASPNAVMDATLIAQYWYLRIKTVATSTSIIAQILPAFSFSTSSGVSNITAIGKFEVTRVFVKNITGLTSHRKMLRAINSTYAPKKLFIADTESQITIS